MISSTLKKLSPAERDALARFYETDGYKALKKFCELDIAGLGKDALVAKDMEELNRFRGQAEILANLPVLIRELFLEMNKTKN